MFTVVEVLASRVANLILVAELMLLGKWKTDKKNLFFLYATYVSIRESCIFSK